MVVNLIAYVLNIRRGEGQELDVRNYHSTVILKPEDTITLVGGDVVRVARLAGSGGRIAECVPYTRRPIAGYSE